MTVTDSSTPAGFNSKSSVNSCPTFSGIAVYSIGANPVCSALIVYVDGESAAIRKNPWSFVRAVRSSPVFSFFTSTFAPTTNALLESRTIPPIRARSTSAKAGVASVAATIKAPTHLNIVIIPPS